MASRPSPEEPFDGTPETSARPPKGRVWAALQRRIAIEKGAEVADNIEAGAGQEYAQLERLFSARKERDELFERQAHALERLLREGSAG